MQQIPCCLEKSTRIGAVEGCTALVARIAATHARAGVDECAGIVGHAIDTVRACREQPEIVAAQRARTCRRRRARDAGSGRHGRASRASEPWTPPTRFAARGRAAARSPVRTCGRAFAPRRGSAAAQLQRASRMPSRSERRRRAPIAVTQRCDKARPALRCEKSYPPGAGRLRSPLATARRASPRPSRWMRAAIRNR